MQSSCHKTHDECNNWSLDQLSPIIGPRTAVASGSLNIITSCRFQRGGICAKALHISVYVARVKNRSMISCPCFLQTGATNVVPRTPNFKMFTIKLPIIFVVLSAILRTSAAHPELATNPQEKSLSRRDYCNNETVSIAPDCWDELGVT